MSKQPAAMAAPVGDQKVIENGGIHNKEADHEAQSHEMNETIGGGVIRNHRYTLEVRFSSSP